MFRRERKHFERKSRRFESSNNEDRRQAVINFFGADPDMVDVSTVNGFNGPVTEVTFNGNVYWVMTDSEAEREATAHFLDTFTDGSMIEHDSDLCRMAERTDLWNSDAVLDAWLAENDRDDAPDDDDEIYEWVEDNYSISELWDMEVIDREAFCKELWEVYGYGHELDIEGHTESEEVGGVYYNIFLIEGEWKYESKRPATKTKKRRLEKMTTKQLQAYVKKNSFIRSGRIGKYQFVTQGNYIYATTNDISEDLKSLNAVDGGKMFERFAFVLDERNWISVADSYKGLDLPLTEDGSLVCQTEDGMGLFNPNLLKELSKFFVSKNLQVFQCMDDLTSDSPAVFIGLASKDRSEVGFLISLGYAQVSNKELAVQLRDAVYSDLYDMLDQRGVSKDSLKDLAELSVRIVGRAKQAEVSLKTLEQLPVEQVVSWGIKQSVFYAENHRWIGEMAVWATRRLQTVARDGFKDVEQFKSSLSYPYNAEEETDYELDLSDYSGVLSQIADKIESCVTSMKGYMDACQKELAKQIKTDPDYDLLMHKDSIDTERFRALGVSMSDFEEFVSQADTWFPAQESFRRSARKPMR